MQATFSLEDETKVILEGTPSEIAEALGSMTESPDSDDETTPSWFGVEYLSSHKGWVSIEEMNLLHVFNAVNKILRTGYRNGESLQAMIENNYVLEVMLDRISAEGNLLGRE